MDAVNFKRGSPNRRAASTALHQETLMSLRLRRYETSDDQTRNVKPPALSRWPELTEPNADVLARHLPGAAFVFEMTAEGTPRFPFVSAACADIYGFTAEAAMTDSTLMHGAIHPGDQDSFERAGQRSAQRLCPMHWEGRIRRADGAVRSIAISSRPRRLPDGATQWHGVVIDRSEAQARDVAQQRELTRINEHQGDMITMAAHDIGAPLASVLGFAEQALAVLDTSRPDGTIDADQAADLTMFMRRIVRNARRIDDLRQDLLIAQAWQSGRLRVTPQAVSVRSSIMAAAETLPAGPDLRISCQPTVTCYAQSSHLYQMLSNLLANAARFAREQVTVRARLTGDHVTITVLDDGPGVPEEFVTTLFDRFTRAKSSQGSGTGLGLFITHKLALANGGNVSYVRGPDGGAAFIIELPAHPH